MKIARVIGTVVAPVQHAFFDGQKLLLVQPERPDGTSTGKPVVALDRAQAGAGDRVLLLQEGSSTRDLFGVSDAPARCTIVGIIDAIEVTDDTTHERSPSA